jgi:hypothetical protein
MGEIKNLVLKVQSSKQELDPELEEAKIKAKKELIELDGRKQFFTLRSHWSVCIIIWISIFILFHISIAIFLGLGLLDFEKNRWFLPSLIIENFLQIIGMGYVVVKFLFREDGKIK